MATLQGRSLIAALCSCLYSQSVVDEVELTVMSVSCLGGVFMAHTHPRTLLFVLLAPRRLSDGGDAGLLVLHLQRKQPPRFQFDLAVGPPPCFWCRPAAFLAAVDAGLLSVSAVCSLSLPSLLSPVSRMSSRMGTGHRRERPSDSRCMLAVATHCGEHTLSGVVARPDPSLTPVGGCR